jgi:biopolymer transport protein ExbD
MFRRRRPIDEPATESLNMTPMIDVVFQLLIFFMLTMHFKEVEGKLLSQLPRQGPGPGEAPRLDDLRVFVCAGGNLDEHRTDKGRHERIEKPSDACQVQVEGYLLGEVWKTDVHPGKASGNKGVYRAAAARLRELHDRLAPQQKNGKLRVVLDADSEVPYEHVIGLVNACKEVKVDDIEFTANPRHDRYYGSFETGQFQRMK